MTYAGWIFLIASWSVILLLLAFSLSRTLRSKNSGK